MKELWVKKTVFRRYLIEDNEIDEVKQIIEGDALRAEELIGDIYDKNDNVEYDEEQIVLPIEYNISDVGGVDNSPVLVGKLKTAIGIKGYETAQVGHPVYETKDRYAIYLKHIGELPDWEVSYYKGTLKDLINFNTPQ